MSGANSFLPFAYESGANVLSDADYASSLSSTGQYASGVVQGRASSQQANKTWRQSSLMASVLGQIIANMGQDASDSQSVSTLSQNIVAAFRRSSLVLPFDPTFAELVGGYPAKSIVADPTTLGAYWVSTADNNLTTPGASNASWQSLFTPVASGRLLNTQVFSASGTYTPTPGTTRIIVTVVGGGGSGGGTPSNNSSQVSVGSGGASGSFAKVILTSGFSAGVGITIGAGGRGVANGGNAGSTTTFGSLIAAPGGGFGGANQITTSSVAGISTTGPSGAIPSVNSGTPIIQIGGSVGTSGQMFGSALVVLPGFGGSSPCGSGGANVSSAPGGDGTGYGAGGGGTGNTTNSAALAGGSGSQGVVIIEEYS